MVVESLPVIVIVPVGPRFEKSLLLRVWKVVLPDGPINVSEGCVEMENDVPAMETMGLPVNVIVAVELTFDIVNVAFAP